MEIVKVYEEIPSDDGSSFTHGSGYAVVEYASLWILEREEGEDCFSSKMPVRFQARMGKVLFYTPLDGYDGGYQACEAFIEGYRKAQPPAKFTSVGSCSV